jgi:alpha-ketoglutarate-dependent 2,4-dichlorophenoxyacetate dioxygenase
MPLQLTPLHPTFAAEASGVDFSKPIPDHVFKEIRDAMNKV